MKYKKLERLIDFEHNTAKAFRFKLLGRTCYGECVNNIWWGWLKKYIREEQSYSSKQEAIEDLVKRVYDI